MVIKKQVTKVQKVSIWAIAIATILGIFGVKEADKIAPVIQIISEAIYTTSRNDEVTVIDMDEESEVEITPQSK